MAIYGSTFTARTDAKSDRENNHLLLITCNIKIYISWYQKYDG